MTRHASGHVSALTGLRGVAVGLVVAAHAHVDHLSAGLFGVDVFFVLSGYLITGVLLSLTPFDGRRWGTFLGRRAARLLPALAVTLVALAGWALVLGDAGTCLALAATHSMDLPISGASQCPGPFHITWSLAAEEQFYLLWPALVVVLARLTARRAAAWCFAGYAGLWAVAEVVAHTAPQAAEWWNYFPTGRPSALLLGSGLAFLLPLRGHGRRLPPGLSRVAVPALLVGLVLTGVLLELPSGPREVLLGPLVAVPTTLLVAALVSVPGHGLGRSRALVWLGEVSYCLYLVHVLALHLVRRVQGDDALLTNAAGVVLALLGAWALHRWVEQPVRTLGYAWLNRREAVHNARTDDLQAPTLVG
ncbi:MAG: putative acyltransferase [Frankiales bacterium]|nr:putative acyltransferase [Frankiales bacterium]